jgi:uncharacterized membrane-anchored protein
MCAQFQTYGVRSRKVSVLVSLLAVSLFSSFDFTSFADPTPAFKLDPVNWVRGPAKAAVGDYAEITIPAGYRFANTEDARILLKLMNNPAPDALAGILAPDTGRGMVVFEFAGIGYVKETGKDDLNPTTILVKLQAKVKRQNEQAARDGGAPIESVEWAQEPTYNKDSHVMEWAIRAQSGSTKAVNHVVRLLGREGVLDGIAVQSEQNATDPMPLQQLMAGVTFKPGHTYADFRKGTDKVSGHNLADMITAELSTKNDSFFTLGKILAASGGTAAVAGVIVWLLVRTRRKKNIRRETVPVKQTAPLAAFTPGHTNGAAKTLLNAALAVKENHANGKQNGHNKVRRRRIFDYQKYYSDLLFQVSDRAYEVDVFTPVRNGSASSDQKPKAPQNHSEDNAMAAGLIESQKHLIEEQQRLIREQTKLIEEKTKLIQEKNQVLEKQAELFGNNVF